MLREFLNNATQLQDRVTRLEAVTGYSLNRLLDGITSGELRIVGSVPEQDGVRSVEIASVAQERET